MKKEDREFLVAVATGARKLLSTALSFVLTVAVIAAMGVWAWRDYVWEQSVFKATYEHTEDFPMIGGVLSLFCAVSNYEDLKEDIADLKAFRRHAQHKLASCKRGPLEFYECYLEYERAKRDIGTYVGGYERAKQLYSVVDGLQTVFSDAHKIARALPATENVHKPIKDGLVSITQYLDGLTTSDLIFNTKEVEAEVKRRIEELRDPFEEWVIHLAGHFPGVTIPAVAVAYAYEDGWAGSLVFAQKFFQEGRVYDYMLESKTFAYARSQGCLMDSDLFPSSSRPCDFEEKSCM
ncbi:MAG: hypothetical protein ABIH21_04830 [Patescibacteria group bacterium]